MAAVFFTTRRTLASLLSRRSRISVNVLLHHHYHSHQQQPLVGRSASQTRFSSSRSGYSPFNDPSPNWSNRPPKETILLDGCDYEHWLIVMEFSSDPKSTEEEMVNTYVKTVASVVGSEEEAKKKIYSVCTSTYTGFGALISEELSYKIKDVACYISGFGSLVALYVIYFMYYARRHELNLLREKISRGLPGVLWVLPDSYLDVPNKDYGGDLFVDGKVIHRPQYRFNERQNTRSRPRPRYDRRREAMQVQRREPMQGEASTSNRPSPAGAAGGQNVNGSDGFVGTLRS